MAIIFLLIALSAIVAIGFLYVFIWNVKSGQYEDDVTPAMRILLDDELVTPPSTPYGKTEQNENKSKT
ncbi:MAG TPA: cbb3-type cytochrome oxidase assembly protein CcoS [Saprospiraceae bacterium]|nr:cbb3-type cytochrome oxidase assembly protein CcoS [Saprospiraceae bacterium]